MGNNSSYVVGIWEIKCDDGNLAQSLTSNKHLVSANNCYWTYPLHTINSAILEVILVSSLLCCHLTDLPASTLNSSFSKPSKPSGQLIILLKTLKGLPIASEKLKVQPVYQGLQRSSWSGLCGLSQSYLLQLYRSPLIGCILAMGNHVLFTKWGSLLTSFCLVCPSPWLFPTHHSQGPTQGQPRQWSPL